MKTMKRYILAALVVLAGYSGSLKAQTNVDSQGAIGNGYSDDHAAITSAITTAGAGGTVEFTNGKTYLSCFPIVPLENQTLSFNGAVLKRCPEEVAVLLSNPAVNMWELDDASRFRVGDEVTASNTDGNYGLLDFGGLVITNIVGNIVTTQVGPIDNIPSYPATFTTDNALINFLNGGVIVEGGTFDGNEPENATLANWTTSKMFTVGGPTIIRNNTFRNHAGDFIAFFGESGGTLIENNIAKNAYGVFAHMSAWGEQPITGGDAVVIRGNIFQDLNQQYLRMSHADGIIEYSLGAGEVIVENNCVDGSPVPFVQLNSGSGQRSGNVTVRNNMVSNTAGFFTYTKSADYGPEFVNQVIEIHDNTLFNTGKSTIELTRLATNLEPIYQVIIRDNLMQNSSWRVSGMRDFDFLRNTVVITDEAEAGLSFGLNSNDAVLQMLAMDDARIEGNTFSGGTRQVDATNGAQLYPLAFTDTYEFINNGFVGFNWRAVSSASPFTTVNEEMEMTLTGNVFKSDAVGDGAILIAAGQSGNGMAIDVPSKSTGTANCVQVTGSMASPTGANILPVDARGDNDNTTVAPNGGSWTGNTFVGPSDRSVVLGANPFPYGLEINDNTLSDSFYSAWVPSNAGTYNNNTIDATATCTDPVVAPVPPGPYCNIPAGDNYDYGDLPACYGTLLADGGARHNRAACGPVLGTFVDWENDGTPSPNADGDDNDNADDHDGVTVAQLHAGQQECLTIESVSGGVLDAWIDFGNDCSMDAADRVATSTVLSPGSNQICFNVPTSATATSVYGRFRITEAGFSSPTGSAPDGEVEDYVFELEPLAVELESFEGIIDNGLALLSWSTSSETENSHFEVEQYLGAEFVSVASVDGNGTTEAVHDYEVTVSIDADVFSHRFRLKQVDYDGSVNYSSEIELVTELPNGVHLSKVYPNPFNPMGQFRASVAKDGNVSIKLYSVSGQLVSVIHDGQLAKGSHTFSIDGSYLTTGIYIVWATSETGSSVVRATLLK